MVVRWQRGERHRRGEPRHPQSWPTPLQPQPMGTHRLAHGALARQVPRSGEADGVLAWSGATHPSELVTAPIAATIAQGGTERAHGTRTRAGGQTQRSGNGRHPPHTSRHGTHGTLGHRRPNASLARPRRDLRGLLATVDECHAPATQTPFSRERARTALGGRILSGGVFFSPRKYHNSKAAFCQKTRVRMYVFCSLAGIWPETKNMISKIIAGHNQI